MAWCRANGKLARGRTRPREKRLNAERGLGPETGWDETNITGGIELITRWGPHPAVIVRPESGRVYTTDRGPVGTLADATAMSPWAWGPRRRKCGGVWGRGDHRREIRQRRGRCTSCPISLGSLVYLVLGTERQTYEAYMEARSELVKPRRWAGLGRRVEMEPHLHAQRRGTISRPRTHRDLVAHQLAPPARPRRAHQPD